MDIQSKYNIICLSNQLWDFPNWTNKRHVMARLAGSGNNVLFVDPPINAGRVLLKQIQRKNWDVKRLMTQVKIDGSVHVFTPVNLLPVAEVTSKIHVGRIKRIAKKVFDPNLKTLLWVYHVQIPDLKYYITELKHDLLIYDCVDNYSGFPKQTSLIRTVKSDTSLIEQEEYLATTANLIFATAPALVEKMQKFNSNVHFTPNVGDYEKFKNIRSFKDQIPADLKAIGRPRVGFTGSLDDYKFDYDLMKKIASDHPTINFVLIGPIALKDREAGDTVDTFKDFKNIHYLGSRDFKTIEYYFAGFDAYMIPYVLNDYTVGGCFPIKFHDSLAAGLPTIVTNMPTYLPFSDVTYISKTYDEFSKNLRLALDEDTPERIKARQAVAKDNSWEGKVAKLLSLINQNI